MMSCKLKCLHFTKDEVVRFFTEYNRLQVPREQQVVNKETQRILNSDLWKNCATTKKGGFRSVTSSGKRLFNALSLLGVTLNLSSVLSGFCHVSDLLIRHGVYQRLERTVSAMQQEKP